MTLNYILTACVLFVGLTIMLVDAAYKLRGSEHLPANLRYTWFDGGVERRESDISVSYVI